MLYYVLSITFLILYFLCEDNYFIKSVICLNNINYKIEIFEMFTWTHVQHKFCTSEHEYYTISIPMYTILIIIIRFYWHFLFKKCNIKDTFPKVVLKNWNIILHYCFTIMCTFPSNHRILKHWITLFHRLWLMSPLKWSSRPH